MRSLFTRRHHTDDVPVQRTVTTAARTLTFAEFLHDGWPAEDALWLADWLTVPR